MINIQKAFNFMTIWVIPIAATKPNAMKEVSLSDTEARRQLDLMNRFDKSIKVLLLVLRDHKYNVKQTSPEKHL